MPEYQPVKFDIPEGSEARVKELLRSFKLVPLVASEASLTFQKGAWDTVDRAALADALRAAGFSGKFEVGEAYSSRFCSP